MAADNFVHACSRIFSCLQLGDIYSYTLHTSISILDSYVLIPMLISGTYYHVNECDFIIISILLRFRYNSVQQNISV
jgi:hypothetical protein